MDDETRKKLLEDAKELRLLADKLSHGLPEVARGRVEAAFYASALADANTALANASDFDAPTDSQKRVPEPYVTCYSVLASVPAKGTKRSQPASPRVRSSDANMALLLSFSIRFGAGRSCGDILGFRSWRCRQLLYSFLEAESVEMCVRLHREIDVRVTRQQLGFLWVKATRRESGDVLVAQGMEVENSTRCVAVRDVGCVEVLPDHFR